MTAITAHTLIRSLIAAYIDGAQSVLVAGGWMRPAIPITQGTEEG
ncbi:MAG: hypothetical protein JWQ43_1662 [Glaciihabitans sp.]|nr:hypothetical protein [Glaciihabitans sp.]